MVEQKKTKMRKMVTLTGLEKYSSFFALAEKGR